MIQQERAQYLVDMFYQTTPNEAWINEPLGISESYKAWEQAKQCAIIAVKEIIKANPIIPMSYMLESEALDIAREYWEKVLTEIEKL